MTAKKNIKNESIINHFYIARLLCS